MMKVSDPIMFGIVVEEFYKDVLEKHAEALKSAGFNPNSGIGDLYSAIEKLPSDQKEAIKADVDALYQQRPAMAMSHKRRFSRGKALTKPEIHPVAPNIKDSSAKSSTPAKMMNRFPKAL